MKVDKLKEIFTCQYCSKLFAKPITLPCGITICESHLEKVLRRKCSFCKETHTAPRNGFSVNKVLEQMLQLELQSFQTSKTFKQCKESVEQTVSTFDQIESLKSDPNKYIKSQFDELRETVDLRKRQLQKSIDTYSNEVIRAINESEKNCIDLASKVQKIPNDSTDKIKTELSELVLNFDKLRVDEEQCAAIQRTVDLIKPKFDHILCELKNTLLVKKKYDFEFSEIDVRDVFGLFSSVPKVIIIIVKLCH